MVVVVVVVRSTTSSRSALRSAQTLGQTACAYLLPPPHTPFSATLEKLNSRFGGNGAGDFNIQWSQASYASQKNVLSGGRLAGGDKTAAFDYSLLQSSAHTLPTIGRAGLSTRAVDKHGNLRPL